MKSRPEPCAAPPDYTAQINDVLTARTKSIAIALVRYHCSCATRAERPELTNALVDALFSRSDASVD
jgi:hypothetical protein